MYLQNPSGFKSKYPWFFSSRHVSRDRWGDITIFCRRVERGKECTFTWCLTHDCIDLLPKFSIHFTYNAMHFISWSHTMRESFVHEPIPNIWFSWSSSHHGIQKFNLIAAQEGHGPRYPCWEKECRIHVTCIVSTHVPENADHPTSIFPLSL